MFQVKLVGDYFHTSTIALGGIVISKEWMTITNDNLLPKAKRNPNLDILLPLSDGSMNVGLGTPNPTAKLVINPPDEDEDDDDEVDEVELQISDAAAALIKKHQLASGDFDLTSGKITVADVRKVIKDKKGN